MSEEVSRKQAIEFAVAGFDNSLDFERECWQRIHLKAHHGTVCVPELGKSNQD